MQCNKDTYEESVNCLRSKYKRLTIGKKEIAHELGVSIGSVDAYVGKGIGIPRYKKLGQKKNSKVIFNIFDVARFLSTDFIETK